MRPSLLILAIMLAAPAVSGQSSLGVGYFVIEGTLISDVASIPTSGITVVLYKADGSTVGQTLSDDTGKFQFRGLTKGRYDVVATLAQRPPLRETIMMDTQNQVYHVHLYIRSDTVKTPVPGALAVSVAYLSLPESTRQEFDRALQASERGENEKSLRSLNKVVDAAPGFGPAHNQMGIVLYRLGRRRDAGEAFLKAIAVDPVYPHALINLGKLLNESGGWLKAIEFLRRGVEADSSSALGFFQLGIAYYQLNSLSVAESYLKRALSLDTRREFPVRLELVNLYQRRGQMDLASEQANAFIQENPNAPQLAEVKAFLKKLPRASSPP